MYKYPFTRTRYDKLSSFFSASKKIFIFFLRIQCTLQYIYKVFVSFSEQTSSSFPLLFRRPSHFSRRSFVCFRRRLLSILRLRSVLSATRSARLAHVTHELNYFVLEQVPHRSTRREPFSYRVFVDRDEIGIGELFQRRVEVVSSLIDKSTDVRRVDVDGRRFVEDTQGEYDFVVMFSDTLYHVLVQRRLAQIAHDLEDRSFQRIADDERFPLESEQTARVHGQRRLERDGVLQEQRLRRERSNHANRVRIVAEDITQLFRVLVHGD